MNSSDFIQSVLQAASEIANNNFGKITNIVIKGTDNNQVLTQTDLEVGKLIVDRIKKDYPNYNVIDEEAGVIDNGSEFTWVVDPIDGTSNFASGVPTYGIMIGLLHRSTPIAGGIVLPYFKETYIAEKEKGTFCNGNKVSVTKEEKLSNVLVSYGIDGHPEKPEFTHEEINVLEKIILSCRNLRSSNSAFDAVSLAKGSYGAWVNRTSKIWDNVAQQIIIEEAGGIYTNFDGKPIDYTNPLTKIDTVFEFCAAAPKIHQQLQQIIHNNS
jgi:myo-inositol-1(or 4)-monophosphatase